MAHFKFTYFKFTDFIIAAIRKDVRESEMVN